MERSSALHPDGEPRRGLLWPEVVPQAAHVGYHVRLVVGAVDEHTQVPAGTIPHHRLETIAPLSRRSRVSLAMRCRRSVILLFGPRVVAGRRSPFGTQGAARGR